MAMLNNQMVADLWELSLELGELYGWNIPKVLIMIESSPLR
jgi:hypothetical protein